MLISTDTKPEMTPYYCGGCILKALRGLPQGLSLLDLYESVKSNDGMGSATFILALDWLYLIQAISIDEEGNIVLRS